MSSRAPRRRALLFLLALALPCVVVVALGIKMIAEGQEVALARTTADQSRLVTQIAGDLMTRLERIKLEEAGALAAVNGAAMPANPRHGEVALVGPIKNGRVELPWDTVDPDAARAHRMLEGTPYARAIAEGERQEFVTRQFPQASASYERAKALAKAPFESDYADLLRARVLVTCNCADDAKPMYVGLLASQAVDDQGVPLALWAARQLVDLSVSHGRVLDLIDRRLDQPGPIAPVVAYLQRDLLETLAGKAPDAEQRARAQALLARMQPGLADLEQALALQRDFPTKVFPAASATAGRTDADWIAFGQPLWLVSQARLAGWPPVAVAVRAEPVFAAAAKEAVASASTPTTVRFVTDGSAGQFLGGAFPGLRVLVVSDERASAAAWRTQRTYYILALGSVVSVTLVGGYFLWRSVQRELRLAELRSQFVSSVSHELRTPLTAIRMFAETLQMGRPLDQATQAEYLNTIVNESERLTRLLNNVLDFSKIERGQRVYRLEPAALGPVVRDAAGAMQYPLARLGFQLHVDVTDDVPAARIDRDAIEQAVLNLLSNAMKYSRDRRDIDLRLGAVNGHAVIEVRDHGLGIAPADQQRIFERFYRAPVPENGLIPGTGLGLALVDHIVKGHGGHVEVRSVPGEGSTFAIHLPLEMPT
jgi:signal transduction histidine kinase